MSQQGTNPLDNPCLVKFKIEDALMIVEPEPEDSPIHPLNNEIDSSHDTDFSTSGEELESNDDKFKDPNDYPFLVHLLKRNFEIAARNREEAVQGRSKSRRSWFNSIGVKQMNEDGEYNTDDENDYSVGWSKCQKVKDRKKLKAVRRLQKKSDQQNS